MQANTNNKTIEIGDYLLLGSYYGEPILWRCVDIDENGPLMLSDKIICIKPFDASGSNTLNNSSHGRTFNNGEKRKQFGSDYWADSNMRSWLNSTASAGNIKWLCGNPPTNDKIWYEYNAYATEKGFLADGNFTASERNAIKTVTKKILLQKNEYSSDDNLDYHRYESGILDILQNYDTAYSEQVTDKMFLLDVSQLYKVYQNRNILGINYTNARPTQKAVETSEYKDEDLSIEKNWNYWLCSPYAASANGGYVRFVCLDDNVYNVYAYNSGIGVRPAFYINTESVIFTVGNGSEERPYELTKQQVYNLF